MSFPPRADDRYAEDPEKELPPRKFEDLVGLANQDKATAGSDACVQRTMSSMTS